jgi:arylsulfatase A-like enzyme
VNRASHGGASAWEIRNTLIVQGPGIVAGQRVGLPSGNIDLAPTVLSALGLTAPDSMSGRILHEALVGDTASDEPTPARDTARIVEEHAPAGRLTWSEYAGHRYLSAARRPTGGPG